MKTKKILNQNTMTATEYALHSALKSLKDKHKVFIGNRKDQITSANAEGFKQGLAWAIGTIETTIEQEQFEEQYNKEQEELTSLQNRYKYDKGGSYLWSI
ncbi:MAG TPA: hypothetical protein GX692_05725 [Acholeplasmataceae bacterium]|nr:hypothetical protein [Acholeplasmataceae bacterium]